MKYFLSILFIFSLNLVSPLLAQDKNSADMSALLENKIWKVQLPKDKHYAMEMEFRSAGWKQSAHRSCWQKNKRAQDIRD